MGNADDLRVVLYTQDGATRVHIEAEVTAEGDLRVAGHDIGEAPKKWFGNDDYEYIVTVRALHKEPLLQALKTTQFNDDASAEARLREIASQQGLPYEWVTQDGDHRLLAMIAATFGNDASAVSRFRDFVRAQGIPSDWFSWP